MGLQRRRPKSETIYLDSVFHMNTFAEVNSSSPPVSPPANECFENVTMNFSPPVVSAPLLMASASSCRNSTSNLLASHIG